MRADEVNPEKRDEEWASGREWDFSDETARTGSDRGRSHRRPKRRYVVGHRGQGFSSDIVVLH